MTIRDDDVGEGIEYFDIDITAVDDSVLFHQVGTRVFILGEYR